jgi:hypothetical protein
LCRAVLSKSNEIALLKYVEMSLRITYGWEFSVVHIIKYNVGKTPTKTPKNIWLFAALSGLLSLQVKHKPNICPAELTAEIRGLWSETIRITLDLWQLKGPQVFLIKKSFHYKYINSP